MHVATITNLAVPRNSCADKIVRSRWVSHVTLYFHSYFFRHDGAKHQYPLLCKYIIDLVRTAIKHERSPYRGRPSKVTPSWGNARTAGGVSNGLACATRLESLMRTCWLGCRDREKERERERGRGCYALASRSPSACSQRLGSAHGDRRRTCGRFHARSRSRAALRAEIYPANRSIIRYLMVFPRECVCVRGRLVMECARRCCHLYCQCCWAVAAAAAAAAAREPAPLAPAVM